MQSRNRLRAAYPYDPYVLYDRCDYDRVLDFWLC